MLAKETVAPRVIRESSLPLKLDLQQELGDPAEAGGNNAEEIRHLRAGDGGHHAQPVQLLVWVAGELLEGLGPERTLLLIAAALGDAGLPPQLGLLPLRPVLIPPCGDQQVEIKTLNQHQHISLLMNVKSNFPLTEMQLSFTQFTLKPNR